MSKKNVDEKNRWVGSAVRRCCCQIIRVIALNSRALYQYGVGGGGGMSIKKKNFGNSPCQFLMLGGESYSFIRHIKIVYDLVLR